MIAPHPLERRETAGNGAAGPAIRVGHVHRAYGPRGNHVLALSDVTLTVERGSFVCLVGASGCGKSTLLSLLAGLDQPQKGTIDVQGRVGLLFQDAALFPWLTTSQNVELALRLAGVARTERARRSEELLARVHLGGFGDRRPHELSGGMRQRAALARALAQGADVLLMDEPFGAVDAMTRDLLHDELESLWADSAMTIMFVTHDVREAIRLADRVVVMSSRPGTIVEEVEVPLRRPRTLADPSVAALADRVASRLRQEVARHAAG